MASSVTIRTFPDPPTAVQSLVISAANDTAFWGFVEEFHAKLSLVNDAGGSRYYFLTAGTPGNISTLTIGLFFAGHTNDMIMAEVMDPLVDTPM